ncbi:uracil-DNA glycosylase [Anaerobacillus sp. CMMVII]|uniref:uracil-DNA glycosylase n=1 Tax=Anaerobacillus sp. CMMVII TaxID=2755588 RepID=UPI0021B75B5E|nr:uracil-DNA glycosylase [Anaerobacillus sp. CMMVII]MCT8140038.1 uracil-DNA glycosylase [Anaerobacillus sp. CMMVII]
MNLLNNDWDEILHKEFQKSYFQQLQQVLKEETATIFPPEQDRFNALRYTGYRATKVVILGQDPYHGEGQAHGLSFSVKLGVKIPPSLKNIYKELAADLGCPIPDHGCLESWAKQGVLLLNTVLSVREGLPNSHKGLGWETFTDQVISCLNEREEPLVFILWGKHAAKKRELVNKPHHLIIESPHPSPFSANRGFFGSHPFSRANQFLQAQEIPVIDWCIPTR